MNHKHWIVKYQTRGLVYFTMCNMYSCYQCYHDLKRGAQFVLVLIQQFSAATPQTPGRFWAGCVVQHNDDKINSLLRVLLAHMRF